MMLLMDTFSSTEVCRASGLTYRMLDYWVRVGVIRPAFEAKGSGSRRGFSLAQFVHLVKMAEVHRYLMKYVSAAGVSTDAMQDLAEALQEGRPWMMGVYVDEDGNVEMKDFV